MKRILWTVLATLVLSISCVEAPPRPVPPPPKSDVQIQAEMLNQASALLTANKKSEASTIYHDFIERYPLSEQAPGALLAIISIQESLSNYQEVIGHANRLLRDYPKSSLRHRGVLAQARSYIMLGDTNQGEILIKQAERYIESDEDRAALHMTLALLDERKGRLANALGRLVEVYNKAPQNYRVRASEHTRSLMTLLSTEELELAGTTYAGRFPEQIILWELGRRYIQSKELEKAETTLTRLVDNYPYSVDAGTAREKLETLRTRLSINPRNIGCILPLSGDNKVYGERLLFGLLLGVGAYSQFQNSAPFRLVIRDSKSNPELAARHVIELATQERVGSIVGPLVSKSAQRAAQEAQRLQIPIITLTQSENVPDIGDYVFRNFITAQMQMSTLVEYAIQRQGMVNFSIFYPDSEYGKHYMNLFSEEVVKHPEARIVRAESYDPQRKDFGEPFKTLIGLGKDADEPSSLSEGTKSIAVDFQGLFIPDDYRKILMIAPQAAYHDVTGITFLGTNLWNSLTLAQKGGKYIQGCFFPAVFHKESRLPHVVNFCDSFKEAFGKDPDLFSAIGYDTAKILVRAIEYSQAWTRDEIKNALYEIHGYPGVTGITGILKNGDAKKELFMLTIIGDTILSAP